MSPPIYIKFEQSNMTGAASGAGTAYLPEHLSSPPSF